MLGRLVREPLLHFLLLGGLLFLAFGRGGAEPPAGGTEIVVTAADIDRIAASFATTWQRRPSRQELQGAINDYIREEVLYRAGVALGLDKDDTIVRRRIRQKMEFFFEDAIEQPQEVELRAYFAAHAEKFSSEPRIAFRQIFLSSKRSGPKADAVAMLPRLASLDRDAEGLGDPLLLPATFDLTPISEIVAQFGEDFGRSLTTLPPGHWIGPLKSPYGFHLVLVTAAEPARLPPFDQVRDAVQREWYASRRAAVLSEQYRSLLSRYRVRVEAPGTASAAQ
jgi:hypothetical protein